MSKQHFRSLFVSDIHMGLSDSQVNVLLKFLNNIKIDKLYLVGDIIDTWKLKRSFYWPNQYNKFVKELIKLAKNKEVYYIPGNHDDVFREFVGYSFGNIEIHLEIEHISADGTKMLVCHGDKFDTILHSGIKLAKIGAFSYDMLLKLNKSCREIRKLFGIKNYWSLSGAMKKKVKNAVKYIYNFEELLINYVKSNGYDGVICGHIHHPNIKNIDGILYCNCGDFIDTISCLVEHDDGRYEILDLSNTV